VRQNRRRWVRVLIERWWPGMLQAELNRQFERAVEAFIGDEEYRVLYGSVCARRPTGIINS
jgi:hypothetical protein